MDKVSMSGKKYSFQKNNQKCISCLWENMSIVLSCLRSDDEICFATMKPSSPTTLQSAAMADVVAQTLASFLSRYILHIVELLQSCRLIV
jgi:hypothetical protein